VHVGGATEDSLTPRRPLGSKKENPKLSPLCDPHRHVCDLGETWHTGGDHYEEVLGDLGGLRVSRFLLLLGGVMQFGFVAQAFEGGLCARGVYEE